MMKRFAIVLTCLVTAWLSTTSSAQIPTRTPDQTITLHFISLNQKVLEMAKAFPADKYDYRPGPGVRSFGEVVIHIASGNIYAAKAGRGANVNWDELDPKKFHGKEQMVAELEKSINDATAVLKTIPKQRFGQTIDPWFDVIEHEAEHTGQLIAYYRVNGLTPPQSLPKKK